MRSTQASFLNLVHGIADITGLELAHRMRRVRPGLPVVVYTGYFDAPTAEQLDAAGIGEVVLKPLRLRELGAAIKGALGDVGKDRE
jgi:DNA-binding NtrC family response regulator